MTREQQLANIHRLLQSVKVADCLLEVRGLKVPGYGNVSGLFDSAREAARCAEVIDRRGGSVYYTINPVSPQAPVALQGHRNKAVAKARASKDSDISFRSRILIDIDPVRPSNTASSEEEKLEARIVAETVLKYLAERGWPRPAIIDSGNGWHLLYRACLPTKYPMLADALRYLAAIHDSPAAHVDTCVHNASRICRMPWTLNRKGPNTKERPHRLAQVIEEGDHSAVTQEQVETLARLLQDRGSGKAAATRRKVRHENPEAALQHATDIGAQASSEPKVDHAAAAMRRLLIGHDEIQRIIKEFPQQLELARITQDQDATYYGLAVCPFAGRAHSGQLDSAKGKTCLILNGQSFGFHCFSDSCESHTIGDLLRLLFQQTGRSPSMQIWAHPETPWRRLLESLTEVRRSGAI